MSRLLVFLLAALLPAAAQSSNSDRFETKIRPVLAAKCYACHSSKLKSPMGGLVLDTKAGLAKGGTSGPAVVSGKLTCAGSCAATPIRKLMDAQRGSCADDTIVRSLAEWTPPVRLTHEYLSTAGPFFGLNTDFEKGRKWWRSNQSAKLRHLSELTTGRGPESITCSAN
jgi:hypothetical protein